MSILDRLTEEQRQVVETWGQGQAVLAGAGCGKTSTLIAKCHRLIQMNSEARIAAVSFTERSASDLREKFAKEFKEFYRHRVATIHGLCGSIVKEFPVEAGVDGEESILSEPQAALIWERAIDRLWSEDVPESVASAFELLLDRESRSSLNTLLLRVRAVEPFGALDALARSQDPSERALELVCRYLFESYDRLKGREGSFDFNDLEKKARIAMQSKSAQQYYQKRFDLVLVDEFQDTNPVQAEILSQFCRKDFANLCVVGDPKQSIYRFRDADVSVFDDFCKKMKSVHHLTKNFRSVSEILEFTNHVSAPIFESSSLAYDPLVAIRESKGADHSAVVRLNVRNPQDLANWVKSRQTAGVALEDMAVLLRKVRGNEDWLQALTSAGIPLAMGSGGFFWKDPRTVELVSFLKFWNDPQNKYSGAVFLRAPWVGMDDATLDEWMRSERSLRDLFLEHEHPLAEILRGWGDKRARPGELLLALLECEEAERELGMTLMRLWHRAEEYSASGLGFGEVVSEISRACDDQRREGDLPPPRASGQLQVLTIHGSKGLEFPIVILVDLPPKKERARPRPLLYWNRKSGAFLAKRMDNGDRHPRDPEEAPWKNLEAREELAESKRLFYVALTRAKDQLVWAAEPTKEAPKKVIEIDDAVYDQDFWRGWIEATGARSEIIDGSALPECSTVVKTSSETSTKVTFPARSPNLFRPRLSVTEWARFLKSEEEYLEGLQETSTSPEERREETSALVNPSGGLSAAEIGTRIHAILESGDTTRFLALEEEVGRDRFLAAPLIQWASESSLMLPEDASAGRRVYCELAFNIPLATESIVGTIDRLIVEPDRAILVDFKRVTRERSDSDLIADYRDQLELYAWAVQLIEGFPQRPIQAVLVKIGQREVCEIPVDLPGWVSTSAFESADHPILRRVKRLNEVIQSSR